jgi:hypothetical protein
MGLAGPPRRRQPGVAEARPVKIDDHPHEPSALIGLETQHLAFRYWPEALLLNDRARPADRDRARNWVVLEVQQVIRQASVGAAKLSHPVIRTMGLALRASSSPSGPQARRRGRSAARRWALSVTGSVTSAAPR